MKASLKRALSGGALALLVALAATAAWADRPVPYTLDPLEVQGELWLDCADFGGYSFAMLQDYVYLEQGREHYDRNGNLVRIEGFATFDSWRVYNSEDPNKALTDEDAAGSIEHSRIKVWFDNDIAIWFKESGLRFHVNVPGYGPLNIDAGTEIWESEDGLNWTPKVFTPNVYTSEADVQAFCNYLQ